MLDAYKELTPVIYGENAVKHLYSEHHTPEKLCFAMHWHDRMEILYVLRGNLELLTREGRFCVSAGQTAVITPCQLHGGFSGSDGVAYHAFMFDVEKFCNATLAAQKYLIPIRENQAVFQQVIDDGQLREILERLLEAIEEENGEKNPLCAIGIIYELLGSLYRFRRENGPSLPAQDRSFSEILQYVNKRFAQRISPKEVSVRFGYNETYFCRRFREITGLTFTGYILALRMERAQRLLQETDEEIGSIAWKCGYSDISYFSHCFKKQFGVSPTGFRRLSSRSG